MSADLVIEPARDGDVEHVVALEALAFPPSHVSSGGAQLRAELARPWSKLWLARFGAASPPSAFLLAWHVADEMHVLNVATHPAARRRGVARALMDVALAFAREHAVRLVLLEVRRSNAAALALYRGLGFTTNNLRLAYYNDGEDAIEMRLELDPATGAIVPRVEVQLE